MGFLALAALLLPQSGQPERAFVELVPQLRTVYVEQPIRLTIRVGVEREYLRQNLLQLFTRPLDVPLQLELASEAGLPGTLPLELDEDSSGQSALVPHPSFVLGEEIVRAARSREETRAGRPWVVLEIERALLPLAPGRLEIPGPILHFAFATRFEQDLVSGSVPLDRSTAVVQGAALVLEIAPWPSEGRPPGFINAVGQFTLAAQAEPCELDVGAPLKLVLTIAGTGNLERLEAPRLDSFAGLHLRGKTEAQHGNVRTLTCELVAESPRTREIPAIALDYFDPDARAYRRASTQPIALRVAAREPVGAVGFEARPILYLFYGVVLLVVLAIAAWVARLLRRRRL